MLTRQDYLDGKCTHSEYYAQFVTESVKAMVKRRIGLTALLNSKDKHLNDIRLCEWDTLHFLVADMKPFGDYLTLAGKVCIAKEAARQIIEETKGE